MVLGLGRRLDLGAGGLGFLERSPEFFATLQQRLLGFASAGLVTEDFHKANGLTGRHRAWP